MSEKPILFRDDLVRAILDGRKTVARRPVRPHPPALCRYEISGAKSAACCIFDDDRRPGGIGFCPPTPASRDHLLPCQFGRIGDVLWVRETWAHDSGDCDDRRCGIDDHYIRRSTETYPESVPRWYPSIHMPRAACGLRLRITDVVVERVQDIDEAEAIAEGKSSGRTASDGLWQADCLMARDKFRASWDAIYAGRGLGWADNPWVWLVRFEVAKP